jgi:hypothetical protein
MAGQFLPKAAFAQGMVVMVLANVTLCVAAHTPGRDEVSLIFSLWLVSLMMYLLGAQSVMNAAEMVRQELEATIDRKHSETAARDELLNAFSWDSVKKGLFRFPFYDLRFKSRAQADALRS